MTSEAWITSEAFAELAAISVQAARKACKKRSWRGNHLHVRKQTGRGGNSGLRYEVLLSSLPEALQVAFRGGLEEAQLPAVLAHAPAPKFTAAPKQTETERKRYAVLRLVMDTEKGSPERAAAIQDASRHHDVAARTIQRWVQRCEVHGWDMDALGRKRPADAGQQRVWVCVASGGDSRDGWRL